MSLEEMAKIDNLKSWTSGVEVDWEAVQQLRNIAALPILAGHVAVMPDVHLGKGATVGSVIPTKAAIIPSALPTCVPPNPAPNQSAAAIKAPLWEGAR
jgi:RNA-splicing ligase RtcB